MDLKGWPYSNFAVARYYGDAVATPTPTPTPAPTPNPSPTPTPAPLQLLLSDSGSVANQVAALDALSFLKDPFGLFGGPQGLKAAVDPNTRIVIIVQNLQLLPGESSSSIIVRFVNSIQQNRDIAAEDVRSVPNFDFAQVTFRLPDHFGVDDYTVSVMAHGQVSNSGVIRIR